MSFKSRGKFPMQAASLLQRIYSPPRPRPSFKHSTCISRIISQSSLNFSVHGARFEKDVPPPPSKPWVARDQDSTFWITATGSGLFILLVTLADAFYAHYHDKERTKKMRAVLKPGIVPVDDISNKDFIARPEVNDVIKSLLQPPKGYSNYDVIVGNNGTGKTTLLRRAAHGLDGVVYVDTPEEMTRLEKAFADALKWTPPAPSWLAVIAKKILRSEIPEAVYESHLDQEFADFRKIAQEFQKKNGRPAVLVFDNVNNLATRNNDDLWKLQQIAKGAADRSEFVVIFVCSGGKAPPRMLKNSAKSRIGVTYRVPDLSEKEALSYLWQKAHIQEDQAREIYESIGGRISQLERIAGALSRGYVLQEVLDRLMRDAEENLHSTGMAIIGANEGIGWKIAREIIQRKRISSEEYYAYFSDPKDAESWLSKKIFAFEPGPDTNIVTFESRIVERAARARIEKYKAQIMKARRWYNFI